MQCFLSSVTGSFCLFYSEAYISEIGILPDQRNRSLPASPIAPYHEPGIIHHHEASLHRRRHSRPRPRSR